jgi:CheY-like chemotaxis protein
VIAYWAITLGRAGLGVRGKMHLLFPQQNHDGNTGIYLTPRLAVKLVLGTIKSVSNAPLLTTTAELLVVVQLAVLRSLTRRRRGGDLSRFNNVDLIPLSQAVLFEDCGQISSSRTDSCIGCGSRATIRLASILLSGAEALARMAALPPELVILDLILPRASGFELLAEWRSASRTADIPIFVLTSKDLTPAETDYLAKNTGALFHNQEPWQESLLRQLQRVFLPVLARES